MPPAIVNGLESREHAAVGALLYGSGADLDADNAGTWCSGTLIGCSSFLTAAHCVDHDLDPSHYGVYFQHFGIVAVSEVSMHPFYDSAAFPAFDVAVLRLAEPVGGITPIPVEEERAPAFGSVATIVGFGQTAGSIRDTGIKRVGKVLLEDCGTVVTGLGNEDLLCWTFAEPVGPAGQDSNTCAGDSGGPLLFDSGSGLRVAGVTSGGLNAACLATDHSYDANLVRYADFIGDIVADDATQECGPLAPVGDPSVTTVEYAGRLSADDPSDAHMVPVAQPARLAVFALNASEAFAFDADLYVKFGPGVSRSDFDCGVGGTSNYASCRVFAPAAGSWSVLVARSSGSGDYQLTATIHDGIAPECGNGRLEIGEECESTADAVCLGLCDATVCRCDPPCTSGPIDALRVRSDGKQLRLRGLLTDSGGAFVGRDPRDGFELALEQVAASISLQIPADDAGWSKSRPGRGRFVWRGRASGFRRVRLSRAPESDSGGWKLSARAKRVEGGAAFDAHQAFAARVSIDSACSSDVYSGSF